LSQREIRSWSLVRKNLGVRRKKAAFLTWGQLIRGPKERQAAIVNGEKKGCNKNKTRTPVAKVRPDPATRGNPREGQFTKKKHIWYGKKISGERAISR